MSGVRFDAGYRGGVKLSSDGRVTIKTRSNETLFLATAAPTSAIHGNPGFEDETAGAPDIWDTTTWGTGTRTVESVTDVVYSGERACRVHMAAGGVDVIVLSNVFDVQGGGRLDFSTFAKATDGDPRIALGLLTGKTGTPVFLSSSYTNNENAPMPVTGDWEMFSRFATIPGGHEKARLFFRITPDAAEEIEVYLDLTASMLTASDLYESGWLELDYGTGWEEWGDPDIELPRVRIKGDDVTIQGGTKRTSGSGAAICQLPEEMWPPRAAFRGGQVVGTDFDGGVVVTTDGVVSLATAVSNGTFVGLDVRFSRDQV